MNVRARLARFVERLPAYLGDVTRDLEARTRQAQSTDATARNLGRELAARARGNQWRADM